MGIFLITPLGHNADRIGEAVRENIAEIDRYELQSRAGWFIKFSGTTVELSNKLGLSGQAKGVPSPLGSALVTSLLSYYGRGPTDMWEWLKTRFEAAA